MKCFLLVVVLALGCTGADISATSGADAGMDNGDAGVMGAGGAQVTLFPATGGKEATGGVEATGGTDAATGGMTAPVDLPDVLPGMWSMTRQQTLQRCDGTPSSEGTPQTFDNIVITDDFQLWNGDYLWWDPGSVEKDVWRPQAAQVSWDIIEVTMVTPDHLTGVSQDLTPGCAPSSVMVFELTRL